MATIALDRVSANVGLLHGGREGPNDLQYHLRLDPAVPRFR